MYWTFVPTRCTCIWYYNMYIWKRRKVIHSSFPPPPLWSKLTSWQCSSPQMPRWHFFLWRDSFSRTKDRQANIPEMSERRIAFPKTQQPFLAWSGINWAAWQEPRHSSHVTVCTDGWNAMGGAKNSFFLLSIPKNHKKVNAIWNVQMATRALEVVVWEWNIKFWNFKSWWGSMQHIYNGKTTVWLF